MEYRSLGKSGLKISRLCLGTMTFGWTTKEKTAHTMMDYYLDQGGNFIDTADVYENGESEKIIGRWLKEKPRDQLVVATKVRYQTGGDHPNGKGLSRKHILSAIDRSLKHLQTDYIDLYQLHCWDNQTPIEETLDTMDYLVKTGKIRYAGVSNFTGWQLQKAVDISKHTNKAVFISYEGLYNLLDRYVEWDILPVCKNEEIGFLCWSPLGGGWLTGEIQPGMTRPPENSRIEEAEKGGWSESWSNYDTPLTWDILRELLVISKELDKPCTQVSINWLLKKGVTGVVLGASTLEQLKDNMNATQWELSADQMKRLNSVSHLEPPRYPYGFINRFNEPLES